MRVESVEFLDEVDSDLYDLEIEGGTHNYVAEGIVVHNTCTLLINQPNAANPLFVNGSWTATSKGVGKSGLVLVDRESNSRNIYLRSLKRLLDNGMDENLTAFRAAGLFGLTPEIQVTIYGETFGKGIQDLTYGMTDIGFRGFDVFIGEKNTGRWLQANEKNVFFSRLGIDMVPILWQGEFNLAEVEAIRDGSTTIPGGGNQIREGVVITPISEREDPEIGRVLLKMVSPDYLLRKGSGTEYQ